jgi:hypothetical protein
MLEDRGVRSQRSNYVARGLAGFAGWVMLVCLMVGCGGPAQSEGDHGAASRPDAKRAEADSNSRRPARRPGARRDARQREEPSRGSAGIDAPSASNQKERQEEEEEPTDQWPEPQRVRSLADLLEVRDSPSRWSPDRARIEVDEARAAAAGIRKVAGQRLTLYTDVALDQEIEVLPEVFGQAFPQWCEYFEIDPADHPDWHVNGFLIDQKERFQRAGLIPDVLPPFENGFAWYYDVWLYEQPSAYYRRHLLLHEGTHSFMNTILRGCGPPWYMEGMAELLGTHRWHEGRLTMNHMPASREEVPMWGRIKIIKDGFASGRATRLEGVIDFVSQNYLLTEAYGWCWGAAALLDGHPRYRQRFRQLPQFVLVPDFSERFYQRIGDDWEGLAEQWQVFVAELEYGYDVARMAIDFTPGRPLAEAGARVRVAADRGWQNSGLRLESGVAYRIRAVGRYQVADQPQIWWCEPGGVSIRYYKGRPLGMLLAAVRADPPRPEEPSALIRPTAVGLGTVLRPEHSGTLFLRINDSAAELDDNAGEMTVYVRASEG